MARKVVRKIKPEKAEPQKNEQKQDTEKQIFEFLRGKTLKEIIGKFGVNEKAVNKLLDNPPKGFRIYRDLNPHGDRIFCLPTEPTVTEAKPKIWTYMKEVSGGPAVDILMPDNIGWKSKNEKPLGQVEKEKIRIVPLSDIWFGHDLHDGPSFDERIDWISRDPHVFCFFNGDGIYPRFKTTESGWSDFHSTLDLFKTKLTPIAHKILWAQSGCFEDKLGQSHYDPMKALCNSWDIPYFTSALSAGIHWAGRLFTFYCVHGRSQAQKKGTKLNAVMRLVGEIEFSNYIVMSHIRDAIITKPTCVREDRINFDLIELKQFAFISPSFVKYDGSRESKWGYPLPFRGQVNCALYKNGDYHWYSSSPTANLVIHNGNNHKEGETNGK